MSFIKHLWQGFAAGPDLNRLQTHRFLLEDIQVKVQLPHSNVETIEPPRVLNYPFKSPGWFEAHMKQQRQHFYVHLNTECWYYLFPLLRLGDGELGHLFCSMWLKRVPECINALDKQQLADWVIQEYDDHYNAEVEPSDPCEQAKGINTLTRRELRAEAELSASRGSTSRLDNLEREIALSLNYPPLNPAKIIEMNRHEWVFYQDRRSPGGGDNVDCYCLPLDNQYYFLISFKLRAPSYGNKRWLKHPKKTKQMVLDSLVVGPAQDTTDNLLAITTDARA